ncbi:MAG: MBL fold metallo-hydrolase [Anaerolineae bacterium]|nr:MBL fold metallo-hydrolase [Anaerolineae bacterium]
MVDNNVENLKISANEVYGLIEENIPFTFVDVRDDTLFNHTDYNEGDGYQLLHLPYTEFQENLTDALAKLPEGKLIFICRSGRKTRLVMEIIQDQPLDMAWLDGGLRAWHTFYVTKAVVSADEGSIYQIARPGRGDLSYAIISDGQAVVIDPMRDIERYEALVAAHDAVLEGIFDTHNHADRISGGRFLSNATGVPYYKHPYDAIHLVDKKPMMIPYTFLNDGDTFQIGNFTLKAIWFPGHTLGMTNFLLTTPQGNQFLFSGDGIFIQSIGRPDLMGEGQSWAKILYESLHTRLNFLTPDTLILPAHFTLFSERNADGLYAANYETLLKTNPMLRPMSEEAFIAYVLQDVPVAPEEYIEILRINHALMDVDDERAMELEAGKNLCSATIEIAK